MATIDTARFAEFAKQRHDASSLDVLSGHQNVDLFRDSLQSALHHMRLAQPPVNQAGEELHIIGGYMERMLPNALADFYNGRHFIAMNTALFVAIQEFTMFCFTQSTFFADIGDAEQETSPRPLNDQVPGIWLLDYTAKGGHVSDHHGQARTPRGESRYVASVYLGLLMARFAWLHEFQHCFGGHVRFAQKTGRALYLNEVAEPMDIVGRSRRHDSAKQKKELRSLELEADRDAFWACCRIQTDDRENIEGIAALDSSLRLRLTLFGAYAITWLFEKFEDYLRSRRDQSHPDPYIRLQNLFAIASDHVEAHYKDFDVLNRSVILEFDRIADAIDGMYASADILSGAKDAGVRADLSEYTQTLDGLQDALAPHRYRTAQT